MSKRETFLSALVCLFIGIVVGLLLSPVRRRLFCKNGANGFCMDDCADYFDDDYDDDDEGEDDMPF